MIDHDTLRERLERHSIPDRNSECHLWTGRMDTSGYGRLRESGLSFGAHRAAWIVTRGPIPAGLLVCHKCDVRNCVNPDHLFLGTHADNMADRDAKGRHSTPLWLASMPRGAKHWGARLTDDAVRVIRADPRSSRCLAAEFNIAPCTVRKIRLRISWKHVQ